MYIVKIKNLLLACLVTGTSANALANEINKDVDQWLYWSAANQDKYEIPVINGGAANALTQIDGKNVVHVKSKNAPADTELYIQVSPWEAYNNFQQGPAASLPETSEFVEITYKSDTQILWQAREGNPNNPQDCMHSYKHPITWLPASPEEFTTKRVYWSEFTNPFADNKPLDTSNVCKFNFVMIAPPAGSEIMISELYLDQYNPTDGIACEVLGNCKININMQQPTTDIYRTYGESTKVSVKASSNETDTLSSVNLEVLDINGYPTGMGGPMSHVVDDIYESTIFGGWGQDTKQISVNVTDALGNEHQSAQTQIITDDFSYTGVTPWLNWRAYGGALSTPVNGTSALSTDEEGNAVVTVIGEGSGDVELIQHLNPYAMLENGTGGPVDLTPFNPTWIQLTYQSEKSVEWQLREGLNANDCRHGYGHNKVFLPASPEKFSTVRIPFTDFKPHGGQDPSHVLDLSNVCKFDFYVRGGSLSIKDMTIENYDPASMKP